MSPTSRLEASQLAFVTAARLRAWAARGKGKKWTLRNRVRALDQAETLELFTKLLDPDAIYEPGPFDSDATLAPWMNDVGNDDPTPVDHPKGAKK